MDIQGNSESFDWLLLWLANTEYSKKSRLLTVSSNKDSSHGGGNKMERQNDEDDDKSYPIFSPAPGNHIMFYKGKLMYIHRNRERMKESSSGMMYGTFEELTIRMVGRNKHIIKELISDACKVYNAKYQNETLVYSNSYGRWNKLTSFNKTNISTVHLKDNIEQNILDDVREFRSKKKEDWYCKLSIPYKRSYLLHGPPGTGKSSLIKSIAGEIGCNIYSMRLDHDVSNDDFISLMSNLPKQSIITFEDVDVLFHDRTKKNAKQKLNIQTILNVMDGILSPYGTTLFMTTNFIDKLDSAFLRAGRVDVKYELTYSDKMQSEKMFQKIFPSSNGHGKLFADKVPEKTSPAKIQQYLMLYSDSDSAIKNTKDLQLTN